MPWYATAGLVMMLTLLAVAWLLAMGAAATLLWHILRDIFRS